MNYLFIRCYEKDDYLARLCFESWMIAGFKGHVFFYTEKYPYKWIMGTTAIIKEREYCNNFGGQLGANALMDGFRKIKFHDQDVIISCDSDVVIKNNPLDDFKEDFGGRGGMNEHGFIHLSGQLLMIRGWVLNEVLNDLPGQIYQFWNKMVKDGIDVADDLYLSCRISKIPGVTTHIYSHYWLHDKPYHLEPRTDWGRIVEETKTIQ